uniref:Uncharacterized protein n=1 Tax=Pyxicephalus adspersus TaxID=30357 RepID=A0AAV2ZY11_PYXAD|nr:TPA: hypothetical protein GDO54_002394 [Pyxicephalus adspersus]
MSVKPGGSEDCGESPSKDAPLPYPKTSALPDVGKIMQDLGIESTVTEGIPDSSSPDTSIRPGGLGFGDFFGRPSEDLGLHSCETSGEFPNVEKIMKDLNIESPVSSGYPENTLATSNVLDSPSYLFDVGFKGEVLNKDPETNKSLCDSAPTSLEKKPALDDCKKKSETGKPS